ncbi:hypothetical protein BJ508DRAFT_413546 [Ascobolus immersus RN42]|uniref:Uncharacterized protein n=1 Tax=Ascobolus immersus RN42 TaxID=1160509 RepID=A0A3N4IGP8_ASCIM|nr:hypothetical protein BJ508DRAFT_413546 [Ascobolus immersus RN42]
MCLIRVRAVEVEDEPPRRVVTTTTTNRRAPSARSSRASHSRRSTVIVQQHPAPSVSQVSYTSVVPPPVTIPADGSVRIDPVNPVPVVPRTIVTSPTLRPEEWEDVHTGGGRQWGGNPRGSVVSNRSREYYVGSSYDDVSRTASKRGHRRVVSVPVVVDDRRASRRSMVGGSTSQVWEGGRSSFVSTGGRRRAGTVGSERIVVVDDGGSVTRY